MNYGRHRRCEFFSSGGFLRVLISSSRYPEFLELVAWIVGSAVVGSALGKHLIFVPKLFHFLAKTKIT
jgi:hypothetical protein